MHSDVYEMSQWVHHRRRRPTSERFMIPQHLLRARLDISRSKLLHILAHDQPSPADPFKSIVFYRSWTGEDLSRDERKWFGGPRACEPSRVDERALEEVDGLPGEGTGWERETSGGVDGSPDSRITDDRTENFGHLDVTSSNEKAYSAVYHFRERSNVPLVDGSDLEGLRGGGCGISSLLGGRCSPGM
jgi:hypothetical protein